MEFVYSTGGREKYFKATNVGDCVTRAICNATQMDYKEVYDELQRRQKKVSSRSVRNGTRRDVWKEYLKDLGWKYHSTCAFGKGVTTHLVEDELPKDCILLVKISKHLTCIKNSVIYDTYNCSIKQYYDFDGNLITNDRRAVYGYWTKE